MICRFPFACRSAWEDSREFRLRTVQAMLWFQSRCHGLGSSDGVGHAGYYRNPALWTAEGGCRLEQREERNCKAGPAKPQPTPWGAPNVHKPLHLSPRAPQRPDLKPQWQSVPRFGLPWEGCVLGKVLCIAEEDWSGADSTASIWGKSFLEGDSGGHLSMSATPGLIFRSYVTSDILLKTSVGTQSPFLSDGILTVPIS